ncbi:MAG: hypothetical protein ABJK59_08085 [Erythrobacter sp.]|uniref:hypothetical protein n=1 Tax=Erythrobacter sp. TaxID=1042 RepID=UPI003296C1D9
MTIVTSTRTYATALIAGLSLLLTGCFITPGKFNSELVLTQDNQFTFTYDGEIFFLGLSSLAEMGASSEKFEPDECYDENTFEGRDCTETELAEQREVWELNAPVRAAKAQEQAKQMGAIMGGIDPSDPQASAELVELLSRQRGWERVIDKGNGVFDVRYSASGDLSHDFMFPLVEGFPSTNPFVQIILREGNLVRVNAPGFAAQDGANPIFGMVGGMAGLGGMSSLTSQSPDGEENSNIPVLEGTFTIVTDGQIKANNTDEGSRADASGERLVWEISPRTKTAPTALIDLTS